MKERARWTREEVHEMSPIVGPILDIYDRFFEILIREKGCDVKCINKYHVSICTHNIKSIDSLFYRTDDGCDKFQSGRLYRLLHPTSEIVSEDLTEKDLFIMLFQYAGISGSELKKVYMIYKYFREKERKDENV